MRGFEIVLALVVAATIVAALAERWRTPAPSLLVIAGLAIGAIPGVPAVQLRPEIVAIGVLPPLLYAAAADVAVSELRSVLGSVSTLAVGLVAASAVAVAFVAHALFPQLSLAAAFVLGAVLASTDPIAVSALARRMHLPPRLLALVQGESLLNDATSLVLFRVAISLATAGAGVSMLGASWQFVRLGGGGALVGLGCAYLVGALRRRIHDPVIETVTALVVPYAIYVAAEAIGTSGVTAVVLAGLYLGERERGTDLSSGPTRLQVANVYAVVQFLLESVIFAVIGLELPAVVRRLDGADRHFVLGALAVVAVVIAVRMLWVYPATYLPHWLHRASGDEVPSWTVPTVISWAGTRGVVPLAAALSIPLTVAGHPFPHRDLILVLTTSCILVTLVVQGLTLEPLVRRLGVTDDLTERARHEAVARHAATRAALARLDELVDLEAAPEVVAARLRSELQQQLDRTRSAQNGATPDATLAEATYRAIRRDLLAAEAAELLRLRAQGVISEAARRKVQRSLDIRETGLG
ncbi:MAG TPA: Na+/H+ antiporter [Jatrophihabitantaceae bacterium]